jgi:hypothetical protein
MDGKPAVLVMRRRLRDALLETFKTKEEADAWLASRGGFQPPPEPPSHA